MKSHNTLLLDVATATTAEAFVGAALAVQEYLPGAHPAHAEAITLETLMRGHRMVQRLFERPAYPNSVDVIGVSSVCVATWSTWQATMVNNGPNGR